MSALAAARWPGSEQTMSDTTWSYPGFPKVQGRCPACGKTTLFLGASGYVTCSLLRCPNPSAASDLLHEPASAGKRAGRE